MPSTLRLRLNGGTFELEPQASLPPAATGPHTVLVQWPGKPPLLADAQAGEVVLTFPDSRQVFPVRFAAMPAEARLTFPRGDMSSRFLQEHFHQLVGLVCAVIGSEDDQDFLWVQRASESTVWVLGLTWDHGRWEGLVVERPRPALGALDTGFYYEAGHRSATAADMAAQRLFDALTAVLRLPTDFPFLTTTGVSGSRSRLLIVKVDPAELWFLCFPMDYFCARPGFGGFSDHRAVQWILTAARTFIQHRCLRLQIQDELRSAALLLQHGVIVLNSYPNYDRMTQGGLALLRDTVLPLLEDVRLSDGSYSLRWDANPDMDAILDAWSARGDREVRYFFANFHTEDGVWCRGGDAPTPLVLPPGFESAQPLRRIRLMRLFHCASIAKVEAHRICPSVAPRLAQAGAWLVEGYVGDEYATDYFASLLRLMFDPRGLRPVLIGKYLEHTIRQMSRGVLVPPFEELEKRAAEFCQACACRPAFGEASDQYSGDRP